MSSQRYKGEVADEQTYIDTTNPAIVSSLTRKIPQTCADPANSARGILTFFCFFLFCFSGQQRILQRVVRTSFEKGSNCFSRGFRTGKSKKATCDFPGGGVGVSFPLWIRAWQKYNTESLRLRTNDPISEPLPLKRYKPAIFFSTIEATI